jgi:hypothetical protein
MEIASLAERCTAAIFISILVLCWWPVEQGRCVYIYTPSAVAKLGSQASFQAWRNQTWTGVERSRSQLAFVRKGAIFIPSLRAASTPFRRKEALLSDDKDRGDLSRLNIPRSAATSSDKPTKQAVAKRQEITRVAMAVHREATVLLAPRQPTPMPTQVVLWWILSSRRFWIG